MSDISKETPQQRIENLLRIAQDALQRVQNHVTVDNSTRLILEDAIVALRAVNLAREVLEELKTE
jgi:hypothetical protein